MQFRKNNKMPFISYPLKIQHYTDDKSFNLEYFSRLHSFIFQTSIHKILIACKAAITSRKKENPRTTRGARKKKARLCKYCETPWNSIETTGAKKKKKRTRANPLCSYNRKSPAAMTSSAIVALLKCRSTCRGVHA